VTALSPISLSYNVWAHDEETLRVQRLVGRAGSALGLPRHIPVFLILEKGGLKLTGRSLGLLPLPEAPRSGDGFVP